jgi:hypothetical protein
MMIWKMRNRGKFQIPRRRKLRRVALVPIPKVRVSRKVILSDDEDVLALDELEDVELHPDAVPQRGIKIVDHKVRAV